MTAGNAVRTDESVSVDSARDDIDAWTSCRLIADPRMQPDGDDVFFVTGRDSCSDVAVVSSAGGPERALELDPPPPAMAFGCGALSLGRHGTLVYAAVDGSLRVTSTRRNRIRRVTELEPCSAPVLAPDGRRLAFVLEDHDVMVASLDGHDIARVSGGADFCVDPVWSPDGESLVWQEWDDPDMPWDQSRLVLAAADGSSPPRRIAGGPDVAVSQARFSPDGSTVAFLSDATGWLNVWTVGVDGRNASPLCREASEHGGPTWGPGQVTHSWSPDARAVACARNEGGFGWLSIVDAERATRRDIAAGVHLGVSWTRAGIVAVRSRSDLPAELVIYRFGAHGAPDAQVLAGAAREPFAVALAEPELVHWPADDGSVLHGRLYRPSARGAGHTPLLVLVHGGPTSQLQAMFNVRVAYYVSHGWTVLVPDYRGSSGWGRAYSTALRGEWGVIDADDCAAGIRAAVARGWCCPARVAVMGASAGGFTLLNLLARHPQLCAAAVDLYGVTDLLELSRTTHRFERHYPRSLVGVLPADAGLYRERSPINAVGQIRTPLLVLHGANDSTVPVEQSRRLTERLRELRRTVDLYVYAGEGHGWSRPAVVADELRRVEGFLRREVLSRAC